MNDLTTKIITITAKHAFDHAALEHAFTELVADELTTQLNDRLTAALDDLRPAVADLAAKAFDDAVGAYKDSLGADPSLAGRVAAAVQVTVLDQSPVVPAVRRAFITSLTNRLDTLRLTVSPEGRVTVDA